MNDNEIAVIMGTLIDADAKEFDSLEKLIRLYGLDDFFGSSKNGRLSPPRV